VASTISYVNTIRDIEGSEYAVWDDRLDSTFIDETTGKVSKDWLPKAITYVDALSAVSFSDITNDYNNGNYIVCRNGQAFLPAVEINNSFIRFDRRFTSSGNTPWADGYILYSNPATGTNGWQAIPAYSIATNASVISTNADI